MVVRIPPRLMSSLRSWLAASGKRYCEICGYKYTFTKGESVEPTPA